ncbi:DUF2461 family protein [Pseudonocardia xinjiangensis]|uniref:DUF2461 domain-containing protein n=1 Tax=Pseudonocardia xinjiangensis TaxID=75289 RepID=A0ABX1REN9_9PSEU|nr:DUF2461 family protein [Pseudonocardia xinjiangensis]NMH77869.1 DUF2461 domain-containing protein [Pseudonocardia xinjiangensis]
MDAFDGWPADATTFLAEITADNSREFWAAQRRRHAAAVHAPMKALAGELEPEFGPVRVLRPVVNRRFRPDAPPYRTDTGGVATSAGGCALAVVLSATALSVTAGHWSFDASQLRRFRTAVHGTAGEELAGLLAGVGEGALDPGRPLVGAPRGVRADHPRIVLLRRRGLQLTRSRPAGPWLATREPLAWVRAEWHAAAPVVAWLDEHVGAAERVEPRPRPVQPAPA